MNELHRETGSKMRVEAIWGCGECEDSERGFQRDS
jgi:hypothetical protein